MSVYVKEGASIFLGFGSLYYGWKYFKSSQEENDRIMIQECKTEILKYREDKSNINKAYLVACLENIEFGNEYDHSVDEKPLRL